MFVRFDLGWIKMNGWRFIRIIIFIVIVALVVVIFDGVWRTRRQGFIVLVVDLSFVRFRGRFIVWFRSWFSINIAIMMIVVMLVIFQIT